MAKPIEESRQGRKKGLGSPWLGVLMPGAFGQRSTAALLASATVLDLGRNGRAMSAQGAALGRHENEIESPKGAR